VVADNRTTIRRQEMSDFSAKMWFGLRRQISTSFIVAVILILVESFGLSSLFCAVKSMARMQFFQFRTRK
jgi:hypothetical protein